MSTTQEEINAKRRERYVTDPEYRRKKLKWNKEDYRRKKPGQVVGTGRGRRRGPLPPMTVRIDGKKVVFYTTGSVSNILRQSVQTTRQWIAKGWLPDTPYRWGNGTRLWTRKMVEAIHDSAEEELEETGELMWRGSTFTERVRRRFDALGLPAKETVIKT